jgi:hypothetical protein
MMGRRASPGYSWQWNESAIVGVAGAAKTVLRDGERDDRES